MLPETPVKPWGLSYALTFLLGWAIGAATVVGMWLL